MELLIESKNKEIKLYKTTVWSGDILVFHSTANNSSSSTGLTLEQLYKIVEAHYEKLGPIGG